MVKLDLIRQSQVSATVEVVEVLVLEEDISPLRRVEPITAANWQLYAMRMYDNPSAAGIDEFYADMKRVKYIRKLVTQYQRGGELKERLILNHIVLLNNVLGPETTVRVLFLKMREQVSIIAPFLILLHIYPDVVRGIAREDRIMTDEIRLDEGVVAALRRIG